jgi:murein DD-endopeptidase MepM/ murein hydrolase activator NlpD
MYTAMAVDTAVTVALSPTIVGGIAKAVGGFALELIIPYVAGLVFESVATAALAELADSDKYTAARGKALGDVIGIGAMAFFSSGAMASKVPGLKMSQLSDFAALQQENESFIREMDVASLSPFDVSSKYTFLGSIVNNIKMGVIQNGGYSGNPLSLIPLLSSLPSSFQPKSASAASDFTQEYCGYAADFGLAAGGTDGSVDAENTPAINAAGLPCTGLTREQAAMSTEEAIDLVMKEGWVTDDQIEEDDSITDLIDKGVIKADTPLTDFIESCGDASTGDYLFNAAGCTTEGGAVKSTADVSSCYLGESGEQVCPSSDEISGYGSATEGVSDPRALSAISVFLLDYQILNSINGEDEPVFGGSETTESEASGEYVLPVDTGYSAFNDRKDWGKRNICSSPNPNSYCYFHRGVDFSGWSDGTAGKPVYSVAEGEVVKVGMFNTQCQEVYSGDIKMDNQVLIKHKDGAITGYSHMPVGAISASGIKVGDTVKAGQQIGAIGNCGNSQGAHLHFTVSPGNATRTDILSIDSNANGETYLNPSAYMKLYGVDL